MILPKRFLTSLIACLAVICARGQDLRLIRSLSGPSGRTEGSNFVLTETRNRFVYPQDKSFVVYFEWDAQPGEHVLTAIWKQPDGRIASMSPDVTIDSKNRELKCYWTYIVAGGMPDGVWTVEIRIDGRPAGSHAFELVGAEQKQAAVAPKEPAPPTLEEIYRKTTRSLVWVHKVDESGRRSDTASGFVIAKNRVATAFQAIDSATKFQVEFPGGRTVEGDEVLALSRLGDWAVLKTETGDTPPLETGDPAAIAIGQRLIACNVESGGRTIGGVDIGGRRPLAGYGERIQYSPDLTAEAVGGPLLDSFGRVVGIVGGSLVPGARAGSRNMELSPALWTFNHQSAVPVSVLPTQLPETGQRLAELEAQGKLTAPVHAMEELVFGGTTLNLPKASGKGLPASVSEFSRKAAQVWVYSLWQQKGKRSKGVISAKIYDAQNRLRGDIQPRKISLSGAPIRNSFGFAPGPLDPGVYRIDVCWDGQAVWRTFIRIGE